MSRELDENERYFQINVTVVVAADCEDNAGFVRHLLLEDEDVIEVSMSRPIGVMRAEA